MGNKPPQVPGSRARGRSESILDASFYNANESKWEQSIIQFAKGGTTVDYGNKNAQYLERINLNRIHDIQPIAFEDNQYTIKFYEFVGHGRPDKEHVFKTSDSDGAKQFHDHIVARKKELQKRKERINRRAEEESTGSLSFTAEDNVQRDVALKRIKSVQISKLPSTSSRPRQFKSSPEKESTWTVIPPKPPKDGPQLVRTSSGTYKDKADSAERKPLFPGAFDRKSVLSPRGQHVYQKTGNVWEIKRKETRSPKVQKKLRAGSKDSSRPQHGTKHTFSPIAFFQGSRSRRNLANRKPARNTMTAHVHHSPRQPVADAKSTPGSGVSREGFLSSVQPANADSKKTKKNKIADFEKFFQLSQNGVLSAHRRKGSKAVSRYHLHDVRSVVAIDDTVTLLFAHDGNKPLQLQASSAAEAREWGLAMQEKKKKLKEQDPETGSGWMILRQGRWGKGQRVYVQLRGSTLSVFRDQTMTITEFCARLDVEGCDVFRKEIANPNGGDPVYSSTDFNVTLAVPVQEDSTPEPDGDVVVVQSPSEAANASGAKPAPYSAPKPREMRLLEFFCEYQPQQASLAQVRQLLDQHKGRLDEFADILRQHHGVAPDLSDECEDAAASEPVATATAVAASADEGADEASSRTEFICLECSVHPSELEQWVSILTCAMSQQDARGSQRRNSLDSKRVILMSVASQLSSAIKELLRSELTYVLRIYLLHKLWITPLRNNGFDAETEEVLGGSRIDQLLELGMQLLVKMSLKILNLPHSLSAWKAADAINPGPSRKPLVNAKGQPFPDLAWVLSDCVALALEALSFVASVSETSAQEVKSRGGVMLACEHFIWSQQQAQQKDDPDRPEVDTGVTKWAKRLLDIMLEAGCVNATQISHILSGIILDMQFKEEAQKKLSEVEIEGDDASESKSEGVDSSEAVSAPTLQVVAPIAGPTLHTMQDSVTHARKIVVVATLLAEVVREMSPYLMQFQPYMQQHDSIRTAVMAIRSALQGRSGRVFKSSRETVIRAVMELSIKDESGQDMASVVLDGMPQYLHWKQCPWISLTSCLIEPVQRLPRYPMLVGAFDSILGKFEKSSNEKAEGVAALVIAPEDRRLLQEVTAELKQLVSQVNESMDIAAQGLHWERIHKHIVDWPTEASFSPNHKDGRLRVAQAVVPNCDVIAACSSKGFSCSGTQWTLFLFEDTVLLTAPRKREFETLGNFLRSQITKTSKSFRNKANSFNRAVQAHLSNITVDADSSQRKAEHTFKFVGLMARDTLRIVWPQDSSLAPSNNSTEGSATSRPTPTSTDALATTAVTISNVTSAGGPQTHQVVDGDGTLEVHGLCDAERWSAYLRLRPGALPLPAALAELMNERCVNVINTPEFWKLASQTI